MLCRINYITIGSFHAIMKYLENLHDLLSDTYPNVNIQSNGELFRLKSENAVELLTTIEALLEAICDVDMKT